MAKKENIKKGWQYLPEEATAYGRFLDFINRHQNAIFAVVVVALLCVVGLVLLRRHYRQKSADARAEVEKAKTATELETLLRENEGSSLEPFIRYRLAAAYLKEGKQKEALAEHHTLQDQWRGRSIYAQFASDMPSRISRNVAFQEEVLPAKLKELEVHYPETLGPPAPEPEGSEEEPAESRAPTGADAKKTNENTPAYCYLPRGCAGCCL
jgi:hypothetical protein